MLLSDAAGNFIVWYAIFIFSLILHEAAHALAALWGGDDTAYRGGQVSLNPWPHIRREPVGTVLFPVVSYFTGGWMMGWASAPFDPFWRQRYPGRAAAMAAAGPAANLVLALIALVVLKSLLVSGVFTVPFNPVPDRLVDPAPPWKESLWSGPLALGLSVALNLNLILFLFNLLPFPPLDGAGILPGLLPGRARQKVEGLWRSPMVPILGLIAAWWFFGRLYGPVIRWVVFTFLYG